MRCQELMKRQVECARPYDSIQHAAEIMKNKGIGFLPICDEENHVLGTLTDRDIVIRCVAEGKSFETTTCEDVMTNEVVSCRPDDDIADCEEHMASRQKSRMLICEGDKLVGVISLSDIAQHDRARKAGKTLRGVTAREVQKVF